jgi:hypothetical protein
MPDLPLGAALDDGEVVLLPALELELHGLIADVGDREVQDHRDADRGAQFGSERGGHGIRGRERANI